MARKRLDIPTVARIYIYTYIYVTCGVFTKDRAIAARVAANFTFSTLTPFPNERRVYARNIRETAHTHIHGG